MLLMFFKCHQLHSQDHYMLHSFQHIIQLTYFFVLIVECKLVVLFKSFESLLDGGHD